MFWIKSKINRFIVFIILVLGMVLLLAQWRAKYVIEDFLERKIPSHLVLNYSDVAVDLLIGNVLINEVSLEIKNRDSISTHTFLELDKIQLKGLSYVSMFFNNTMALDAVVLTKPELNYYPYKYIPSKKAASNGLVGLLKTISVEKLDIQEGSFKIMKNAVDSIQVSIDSYDFTLYNSSTDPKLITQKIPLKYDGYDLKATEIFADLGKYETLRVKQLSTSESELQLKDVLLSSKFNKIELSRRLKTERDHIELKIPQVKLKNIDFGFEKNRFEIATDLVQFKGPRVKVYRDKLVNDDLKYKPLYSKILRELPIGINVEQVKIEDGYLAYEERIFEDQDAGMLFFEDLNAEMIDVSNFKDAKDTKISANANLMGHATLKLNWDFKVNDIEDVFNASGVLLNLQAEKLNSFLEPNLSARAKGSIEEMYFTISGNRFAAEGDMKMKYRDFQFDVLGKDRLKINKILTVVGNFFVNDGSKTDMEGFRHGNIEVERETNKSFFNYLWLNVRDGIIDTLTGDGKKED